MLKALTLVNFGKGTHWSLAFGVLLEDPCDVLVRGGVRSERATEQDVVFLARVLRGLLRAHTQVSSLVLRWDQPLILIQHGLRHRAAGFPLHVVAVCEDDILHSWSFSFLLLHELVSCDLLTQKRLNWVLDPDWPSPVKDLVVESYLVRSCILFLQLLLSLCCLELVYAYLHGHGLAF